MRDTFAVLTPGGYTTVQDKGRYGYQDRGVPVSGVLDAFAYRVANLLVGNREDRAVLEITVMGPRLEVLAETQAALTGADMGVTVNDQPLGNWQSFRLRPGDILDIHQVKSGCRAYLAVHGGIDVPAVMGSRSTYVSGKLGGHRGRPLKSGDILQGGGTPNIGKPHKLPSAWIPRYDSEITLRAVPGPQDDYFADGLETLFASDYLVSAKADRMGYRLQGPAVRQRPGTPPSIISEPSMPGSIQIPADAQPIILLAEQTVGGYAKIATVVSADLYRIAQATPGDTVHFEQVSLETAHALYREREEFLHKIAPAL